MTEIDDVLGRLRATATPDRTAVTDAGPLAAGLRGTGVGFAALGGGLEDRWHQALAELGDAVASVGGDPILLEGGPYRGCWLESTATIGAEVLGRFAPEVTRATHLALAAAQRADGLLPYKLTADGPAFTQIQTVTPLARSVWHHYLATAGPADAGGTAARDHLARMYTAMVRNDAWLAAHRDTRGTGGVEAFCTFDTGHDLSPRFWHVPDRCHHGDAARYDPDAPGLPFVAPDLTANVACQRHYLALIAAELGEDPAPWRAKAAASRAALYAQCWDATDGMYYDRAADGSHVRVGSDVLLRVLACEVADDVTFAASLDRHLMNTRRFLSAAGFTSVAMDDPRFDGDHTRNSWAGPVNALTMLRAPHAFEHHGRVAELALAHRTLLGAMAGHDRFAQCFDPWSADAGFTSGYSPAMLWLLDALERDAGVLPRPDGDVWLSGLIPTRIGEHAPRATAAARTVAGVRYELAGDDTAVEVHRDGAGWLRFPRGWRIVLTAGEPTAVVGLAPTPVTGTLHTDAGDCALTVNPNERVALSGIRPGARKDPGFTPPRR